LSDFKPLRVVRGYSHELDAPTRDVFPLLCPVREYEWIDIWDCELVHSASGYAELDCVFTTDLPLRGRETWLVSGYNPGENIEFAVHGPGRVIRYTVSLEGTGEGRSRITWTQVLTGLDESGNDYLAALTRDSYETRMRALSLALNHFLAKGRMLPMAEAMKMAV